MNEQCYIVFLFKIFQHIAKFFNVTPTAIQSYGRRLSGIPFEAKNLSYQPSDTGQMSDLIHHLTIQQSPVFLVNSRNSQFYYAQNSNSGHSFSRSYGVILPSSFNLIHSKPSYTLRVHLCRFRVRSSKRSFFSSIKKILQRIQIVADANLYKFFIQCHFPYWLWNFIYIHIPILYGIRPLNQGPSFSTWISLVQKPLNIRSWCISHQFMLLMSAFSLLISLISPFEESSLNYRTFRYRALRAPVFSVDNLSPLHFWRRKAKVLNQTTSSVSYYAFFK